MPAVTVSQLPDRSWVSESFAPTVSEPCPPVSSQPFLFSHSSWPSHTHPLSPLHRFCCPLVILGGSQTPAALLLPPPPPPERYSGGDLGSMPLSSDTPATAHSCATQQKKLEAQRRRVAQDQAGKLPNEAEKLPKVKNVTKHIYLKTTTRPAPPCAGKTTTMLHPGL